VTTLPPPPAPTDPAPSSASQSSINRPSANSTVSRLPRASPSIRRFARELGVELTAVRGSGPSGRILKTDLQSYVKTAMSDSKGHAAVGRPTAVNIAPWPKVDFSKFGRTERAPLSKIRKLSGENLARNWVTIPHVTNFEDADITELEAFRNELICEEPSATTKITMLAFLIKAASVALKKFPQFNSSLIGDELVLKHYFHIGFAADTPNDLVVPVIRDVDTKGILQIAAELGMLAGQARDGKLKLPDTQGGCFTISSLGGIGGTGFTPIINAPEVAILGVTRAQTRPIWTGNQFQPRIILPIVLSWDHRVVDGAAAARFLSYSASLLEDFRRIAI
jgi:pyruvate dehydrogenase E2 component (dihydrolipoamide acetyltransferase)